MKEEGIQLLGYTISNRGLYGDVQFAYTLLNKKNSYLACMNPHSLVIASKDKLFQCSLKNADILLPDGIGIVLAARLLGLPLKEKVAGYDFFYNFTKRLNRGGGAKYFFLGSTENVLRRIKERIKKEFPSIEVCGYFSPPFKEEFSEQDNNMMIKVINKAKPDILWVGMTAPKQEKWIFLNKDKLEIKFCGAIGAAFDFYAGTKTRPSLFWQKIGLEWLLRFLKEPRLWKRNLISTPIFLYWVLKEIVSKKYHS